MTAASFFLALAADLAIAAAFYPLLAMGRRTRAVAVCVLGSAIAMTPLLVAADSRFARLVLACVSACYVLKLIDLHIGALRGQQVGGKSFFAFLGNLTQLVQRRTGSERQPTRRDNAFDLLHSSLAGALAFALLRGSGQVDWAQWPFLLQHAVRAILFFVLVLFLFRQIAALIRMLGGYSVDPEDEPLLARTPADFWRRYNRWIGQFLQEDVFKPLGGRRHPARITMIVFALSGVGHEYIFWIATGRVQGYQLAFFLLQGAAVVLTMRIKPTGAAALLWGGGTLVFNLLSSVLFFASLQGVGPIYPTGLPAWFPVW